MQIFLMLSLTIRKVTILFQRVKDGLDKLQHNILGQTVTKLLKNLL